MSFCDNDIEGGPFFFEETLHVNERKPYWLRGKINLGEQFVAATVDIVDDSFAHVVLDSPITINFQNFGQISGVKWGVMADLSLADQDIGCCSVVWLRFSIEIDATPPLPLTRKVVQIWGVRVAR